MIFGPQDFHLLSPAARHHEGIQALVMRATRLIVDAYREHGRVMLQGFSTVREECDDDLLEALQLTIAGVVDHMSTLPAASLVAATRGARSESYSYMLLPPGAFRLLDRFDTREPLWRV